MKPIFQTFVAAVLVAFGVLMVIFAIFMIIVAVILSPLIWVLSKLRVPGAIFNREEIRLWNILKIKLRK